MVTITGGVSIRPQACLVRGLERCYGAFVAGMGGVLPHVRFLLVVSSCHGT